MSFFAKGCTIFSVLLVFGMVSASLLPWKDGMFDMHDMTQAGRVESFVGSLRSLHIPPRLAPEFSYNLGFPVFSFYAPTAYWITGVLALAGFSVVVAIKLSFLLAVLVAFFSTYYLLSRWVDHYSALLGGSVTVTSTYVATEIMIRGNLAETWFLALFPLSLALLIHNSATSEWIVRVSTTLVLALLFTTHNMLGLFGILICLVLVFCLPQKKSNLIALLLALCIDSYFFLPAFGEGHLVQAQTVAKEYAYSEHFLCPWQLWTANGWGLGGSLPGCEADSMSFKLGKLQIILGVIGALLLLFRKIPKHASDPATYALLWIGAFSLGAVFLTLEISKPIWDMLAPVMALFQFPWRFLIFAVVGMGIFAGYAYSRLYRYARVLLIVPLLCVLFLPARKYFIRPLHTTADYLAQYASLDYRQRYLAYNMREYIATPADYAYWNTLNPATHDDVKMPFEYTQPIETIQAYTTNRNTPFEKEVVMQGSADVWLNIHYFPYWEIRINGREFTPTHFDRLARPLIAAQAGDVITLRYDQTDMQKFANFLSIFSLTVLCFAYATVRPLHQEESDTHG